MGNSDKLLEKIKADNIQPKPKWQFDVKNNMVWLFYFLFVLIGSISFSIILFAIQQTDFELLSHMGHSKLELFLSILPFIWLILLVVFILGSIYAIYNSKRGYKFTFSKMIAFNVGLSLLIGTVFFVGGGASWFEKSFALRAGFYESIQNKKEKIWQNPEKGNIAGTIQAIDGKEITFKDFDDKIWKVNIEDAFVPRAVFLEKGEKMKISGKVITSNTFNAEGLYPWGGKGLREKMRRRRENNN